MSWRRAPAGLVRGPRKLKIVRTASSLRTGTTKRVAWWCAGANMKPNPHSRMQSATASGERSRRAPSASIRSAEPDCDVAERLPCLATAQPAPAAISAAVVETLKVWRPPPVPAVSIRSSRAQATGRAKARIVRARPTISSTVSPFVRSAISTAEARGLDELAGQRLGLDDQRVVTADHERVRQPLEQALPVVDDVRRLAVHGHVADHAPAERLGHRLMPEAHAQRRYPGLREAP